MPNLLDQQEQRNAHCNEILARIGGFADRYHRRPGHDETVLKTLNTVFKELIRIASDPKNNGNFTPKQEAELVGLQHEFRNEIDFRINHKSADKQTREIHMDAMNTLNGLNGKDNVARIVYKPNAAVTIQNNLRDLVETRTQTQQNTPRNG